MQLRDARQRIGGVAKGLLAFISTYLLVACATAQQQTLILDNGFAIGPGALSVKTGLDKQGSAESNEFGGAPKVAVIDDGLRWTHVSTKRADRQPEETPSPLRIRHRINPADVCRNDAIIEGGLGSAYSATPFDPFGRRIYSFQNANKKIVQGITEITPLYARIQALEGNTIQTSVTWDTRVALSAIPPLQLRDILMRNADPNRAQDWLDIVSLYMEAKRFVEAREMLVRAIGRFPELEKSRNLLKQIDQLLADQMFEAVLIAQNAGQHAIAEKMLRSFDAKTVSIETRLKIDRRLDAVSASARECDQILAWLREDLGRIADPASQQELLKEVDEIARYLNSDTRERFADYVRLRSDPALNSEQRAALGMGGWLYGAGLAEQNLSIVRSGYIARRFIQEYLASARKNDQLIQELSKLESGTPRYVARILANMAPPISTDPSQYATTEIALSDGEEQNVVKPIPGRYVIDLPLGGALRGTSVRYTVQLPAEYNPYRRYPCVVALGSQELYFLDQLDWWVGLDRSQLDLPCYGEAARHGFIVIAPEWNLPKQPMYNYTENEKARVLATLRDAMRRFSIDTDRVFISGHFMGADAAWDLAFSHPDLWAGAIMIGGIADKFVVQYWENAQYVPTYFVNGEFDGANPMLLNGKMWDKLLSDRNIDSMVTLYQGRGHDHFQEELPRIIEWMQVPSHRRNFNPDKFTVKTSRAGDRFFWWFETSELYPKQLVNPLLKPAAWVEYQIDASLNRENNSVRVGKVPADRYTIWLTENMVDFTKRVSIETKGPSRKIDAVPSTQIMLEDVRGRGDRQHPFWYRVDLPIRDSGR
jgi:pimeloyl-ACP methyl ester carboxylesterase